MVWSPRCGSDDVIGIAAPPADAEAFIEFGIALHARNGSPRSLLRYKLLLNNVRKHCSTEHSRHKEK
jgi:hypothetical protein